MLTAGLPALHSDAFLIGAYADLRNHYKNADQYNASMAKLLKEAGFNAVKAIAAYEPDPLLVENMAGILDRHALDLILEDQILIPGQQYGISALSAGVDQIFEAEYANQAAVNPRDANNDTYFYQSAGRVGHKARDRDCRNGWYWKVPAGKSGHAFADLLYRWPTQAGAYYRVGPEFRFLRTETFSGASNYYNTLYVKYVFKVDKSSLAKVDSRDTLAVFSFWNSSGPTVSWPQTKFQPRDPQLAQPDRQAIRFFYGSTDTALLSKPLTKAEYLKLPSARNPKDRKQKQIVFRFPVSSSDPAAPHTLQGQKVVTPTGWYWQLKNLDPLLWWMGKGELQLDYVEFYDEIFATGTTDKNALAKIRSFPDSKNIVHYYGVDEPKPPQYRSFALMSKYLAKDRRQLLTALDFDRRDVLKPDSEPYRSTQVYIDQVKPNSVMIDRYPFVGGMIYWQGADQKENPNFVQNRLQFVLDEYERYRRICDAQSRSLYMVTQIYGEFEPNPWQGEPRWYYLPPPDKMAKCLQLLPLCYKPGGVVSFKFDNHAPQQYTMLKHSWSNAEDAVRTELFAAVRDANLKLQVYGPLVKSKDWRWIGAATVPAGAVDFFPAQSLMRSLRAEDRSGSGLYDGYIQTALYLDADNNPAFMAVNRRTNQVTTKNSVLNYARPESYSGSYSDAPPQWLCFRPADANAAVYGTRPGLYDPFSGEVYSTSSDQIEVEIGPGDGVLLQLCSTLPSQVTVDQELRRLAVLNGEIEIVAGAKVTAAAGTRTIVKANSRILVRNGGSLRLRGKVLIESDAVIEVEPGGVLDLKKADCVWEDKP